MKNTRAFFWLSLIFIVTVGCHVFLHFKGGSHQALVQRTHLLDAPHEQPFRISVARASAPLTELVRTRQWRLTEPYAAIADERVILKMLDSLSTATIETSTTDQELLRLGRTRADFGLSVPAVEVSVATEKGVQKISFGEKTPSGNGYYASVNNEDAIYIVASNVFAAVNLTAEDFRQRALFSIGAESVLSFDVKRSTSSFLRFVREGDLWYLMQPQKTSAAVARVKSLLTDVLSSVAVDFVWPTGTAGEPTSATAALLAGYGLDSESAVTVTIRSTDGIDRQISFGKSLENNRVYALTQNDSAIVTLPIELKDAALANISEFTDTRIFPLEADVMTSVSVTDGETTYLLAKDETGEWRMESPVAAATDRACVANFISRICSLRHDHLATNGVAIAVMPGEKTARVSRHAVLNDVCLENLRSREIVRIDAENVRRLVVTDAREEKPTAIVYDANRRAWNVESSQKSGVVSHDAVAQLLAALNPLRAREVVKLKVSAADLRMYGLDNPWLTLAIDLRQENVARRNILIGRELDNGDVYATLGAADAVFVLPAETVQRFTMSLLID